MVKTISEMIVDGIGKFYTQFKSQRILKSKDAVLANTNPDNLSSAIVVKELYNNLTTSFQAGVDTLYNACVSCGVTPSAKTPAAISAAISAISTNRYNAGRTQGQNDVKGSPNSYGLYTGAQYTANYNAGYNAGRASVINTNYRITVLLKADVYNGSNEFTGEQAFTAQTIDIVNGAVSTSFPTNGHPNQALNRPGIGSYSGGVGWHMVNLKSISVAKI